MDLQTTLKEPSLSKRSSRSHDLKTEGPSSQSKNETSTKISFSYKDTLCRRKCSFPKQETFTAEESATGEVIQELNIMEGDSKNDTEGDIHGHIENSCRDSEVTATTSFDSLSQRFEKLDTAEDEEDLPDKTKDDNVSLPVEDVKDEAPLQQEEICDDDDDIRESRSNENEQVSTSNSSTHVSEKSPPKPAPKRIKLCVSFVEDQELAEILPITFFSDSEDEEFDNPFLRALKKDSIENEEEEDNGDDDDDSEDEEELSPTHETRNHEPNDVCDLDDDLAAMLM